MSVMVIPEGLNLVLNDEILSVEQLTVAGQMTGTGTLITNCDLLVGLENIAETIECACRVDQHFFSGSFQNDEGIVNNDKDLGILFAYAAHIAPILTVDIDGSPLE